MDIKYPNVSVQLAGEDGNAYSIMGRVIRALRRAKVPETDIEQFKDEATSGDYDNLLTTCMRWVNCD